MKWVLPQGIEDVRPPRASALEVARRRVLDLFASRGYDYVVPPLAEFVESLLTAAGSDLRDQTLQVTDPLTGRQLAIRPDITPQIARIDATRVGRRDVPARYCYAGTVLTARPRAIDVSRTPFQVGAELFGHSGVESDVEVVLLMLNMLADLGVPVATLGLSHVGVFHALCADAGLAPVQEMALFDILQRKAHPDIQQLLAGLGIAHSRQRWFQALADLHGDARVLGRAREALGAAGPRVSQALAELDEIHDHIRSRKPDVRIYFDLGEMRGYHYHTGIVFGAYVVGEGQAIAGGGRYDGIGAEFGAGRPATGFSADLKKLIGCSGVELAEPTPGFVLVPWCEEAAFRDELVRLKAQGFRLVNRLTGAPPDPRCRWELVERNGRWVLDELPARHADEG